MTDNTADDYRLERRAIEHIYSWGEGEDQLDMLLVVPLDDGGFKISAGGRFVEIPEQAVLPFLGMISAVTQSPNIFKVPRSHDEFTDRLLDEIVDMLDREPSGTSYSPSKEVQERAGAVWAQWSERFEAAKMLLGHRLVAAAITSRMQSGMAEKSGEGE